MALINLAGTVFVAASLLALGLYFGGGVVKQLGETTGMVTLTEVGQGGINTGTIIIFIIILILIVTTYFYFTCR